MPGTFLTLVQMNLHANELDTGQGVIDERKMLFPEIATVHIPSFEGSDTSTHHNESGSEPLSCHLLHVRRNDLSERIARPVEPRLDRSEIAVCNLCDLFVRLSFELTKNEDIPVMLWQLCHRLLDDLPQVPLTVHVIRPRGRILELKGPVVLLPVLLNRLEQHQRVA